MDHWNTPMEFSVTIITTMKTVSPLFISKFPLDCSASLIQLKVDKKNHTSTSLSL